MPKHKKVETCWHERIEYLCSFDCPYCGCTIDDFEIEGLEDGDPFEDITSCPKCRKKFRLRVE